MKYVSFIRKTRNQLTYSSLKIFPPTKHQISLSQNPDVYPNKEPIPSYFSSKPSFYSCTQEIKTAVCHTNSTLANDITSLNRIITSYVRSGDIDSAFKVFNSMKVKTTITWNSILAAFLRGPGKLRDARELFDKIPDPDTVSYNIMLACYIQNCDKETSWNFFHQIPFKDIASWNTMISGFVQSREMEKASQLFSAMREKNSVTWSAMISGYIECGELKLAMEFFEAAPAKSVVAWTAMVSGYMKFGKIELAEKLFREMPVKNLVTWNAMIAGYVENSQPENGLKLFKKMIEHGLRPNPSSLSSVLLGCSELSALQLGEQVHQLVWKTSLCKDITACTSLISMYCKCGNLDDARKLFLEIPGKDIVSWNSMISGYAQHGEGRKALCLFDEMRHARINPDWITFVALLLACNHSGLVDMGVQFFYSMERDYGIEARPDHYTCMVDLLGRAGKLMEAITLIKKMPYKPHVAIFGTLLGACRIHKNSEIAEYASKKLLELDPTSAAGYVQLANVYAAMKKWDDVARIRKLMKQNQVVKNPGYSWIEIGSIVHEFRSGDRIHPELNAIHGKLKDLERRMKLSGYVPDLEFALHDVEEEQKAQMLLRHSEKLAIAFGIIKVPLGFPIRVFKNLRVCGDCHCAIKYISAIERREIIVRDTIRFHHFKEGSCSCGDYW